MARRRDPDFMNRLARAGMEIFARDGLANARMSEVAERLGVSQGTLYNYVESKDALFCIALDRATGAEHIPLPEELPVEGPSIDSIRDGLEEAAPEAFGLEALDAALERRECEDPAEELREIVEEFYDRLAGMRWAADVIERSARDIPELHDLFFLEIRRSVIDRIARYLTLRGESGCIRTLEDPGVTARLLTEIVDYAARRRHRDPDPRAGDLQGYRDAVTDLVIRGLLLRPPPVPAERRGG